MCGRYFLRAEIPTAHASKLVCAIRQANFLYLRYRPVDVVRRERVLAADDPTVLDHALHADNTQVDRGDPAIAVLSIGYQSLGSCSRAAGWSAATLCSGTFRTCCRSRLMSVVGGRTDLARIRPEV